MLPPKKRVHPWFQSWPLKTGAQTQDSRAGAPTQDSRVDSWKHVPQPKIALKTGCTQNSTSRFIKTSAEAKIPLETGAADFWKQVNPTEKKQPVQHKVPDSSLWFQSRQNRLLKANCPHQKRASTQDPRVDSQQHQVPGPKIPELTPENRCPTKIPGADSWKPESLPETGAQTHDTRVGSWKQVPDQKFQSWLLKTGAPIQDSRVDFWNRCRLLKGSPGPKTKIPELTSENGCPDPRFQSWVLKTGPEPKIPELTLKAGARTQDSRVDSWKRVAGPKIPELNLENSPRTQDSWFEAWNHVPGPRFQGWLLRLRPGPKIPELTPETMCVPGTQDSRVDSWKRVLALNIQNWFPQIGART